MSDSTPTTSRRNSDDWGDAINEQPPDAKAFATMTQELKTFNLSDPGQMVMIDKLRELGIGSDVDLPQLVVVGDQSSGKSSVLEAITDFPFPRDSRLCTRFVTNIILKRSDISNVSVSLHVNPEKSSGSPPTIAFDAFNKRFENLNEARFRDILDEALRAMDIMGKDEKRTASNKAFSDDILKVELSGPDQDNLNIIDVPGIFRNSEQGKTTKEDIKLVNAMVRSYIRNERTIILAVLAANVDLANQEILDMALEADPKGLRTLRVLTKPDLVDKGGEKDVTALFQDKDDEPGLGYCIVRNRAQEELTISSTHRFENERKFFLTFPWNTIDKDRIGIHSLKSRLQTLLANMINREFPKLKLEIDKKIKTAKTNLKKLGDNRESPDQQRKFLEGIAMKFQDIRTATMDTFYFRHEVLENDNLRLPTLMAKEFEDLVVSFKQHGHTISFNDADESDSEYQDEDETEPLSDVAEDSDSQSGTDAVSVIENVLNDERYPELDDITIDAPRKYGPHKTDAKKWIEKEYRATRGYDLQHMKVNVLPLLWRTQSQNWLWLTKKFTDNVITLVHRYIHQLLARLCGDGRTMEGLRNLLMDDIIARYKNALYQIELTIKIELHESLITKNHYLEDTLSKIKSHRNQAEPEAGMETVNSKDSNGKPYTRDMKSQTCKSEVKQVVDDLHSLLKVYHKVARKRVVDNIIKNVDYFLLTGENSPLNILTPMYISSLSNDQLEQIAGEDMMSKSRRRELNDLIGRFEKGRRVIRGK